MAVTATQIAAKFKNKGVQNEFLDTFKKEKVRKQSQQRALVKAVPRGTSDITVSLAQIRRQLKDYRGLVDITESRLELLAPGLRKLKKDSGFVNKMKIYKIPFTWSGA